MTKIANDNSENKNDSKVQFQNKDASFQIAIDENDDKKDIFEKNDLLAFSPKNVPTASKFFHVLLKKRTHFSPRIL